MSGTRDNEASAHEGTAEDLTKAHPALADHLARKHLGKSTGTLSSEDAARISGKIARDLERRERG